MTGNGAFFLKRNIKNAKRTYLLKYLLIFMVSILLLRSVGASKRNVLKVIIMEKGYISLLSVLIGSIGGIVLEKLLINLSISEKIPFSLPYMEILAVMCTMLIIIGITVRIQSGLIRNMNIADELKQAEEQ